MNKYLEPTSIRAPMSNHIPLKILQWDFFSMPSFQLSVLVKQEVNANWDHTMPADQRSWCSQTQTVLSVQVHVFLESSFNYPQQIKVDE